MGIPTWPTAAHEPGHLRDGGLDQSCGYLLGLRARRSGHPEQRRRTSSLSPPPHAPSPDAHNDSAGLATPRLAMSSTTSWTNTGVTPSLRAMASTVAPRWRCSRTRCVRGAGVPLGDEAAMEVIRGAGRSGRRRPRAARRPRVAPRLPLRLSCHRSVWPARPRWQDMAYR